MNMIVVVKNQSDSLYSDDLEYIVNSDLSTVSELFLLDDFRYFVEEVITSSFESSYTSEVPLNATSTTINPFGYSFSGNTLLITAPTIDYTIDDNGSTSTETTTWKFDETSNVFFFQFSTLSSIKSIRSYEVGLVYLIKNSKSSTVLTSKTNTISVGADLGGYKNQFRVLLNNKPPKDAIAYRYAIKQTRGAYYNIFASTFYEDGNFVWVKLEGSDKDKVTTGDILYVRADSFGALSSEITTTVLDVQTKESDFIEGNQFDATTGEIVSSGGVDIIEDAGVYMKIKPSGYSISYDSNTFLEYTDRQDLDKNRPTRTIQFRDTNGNPEKISKGAKITIDAQADRENSSIFLEYIKSFVATRNYDSFADFFLTEVAEEGDTNLFTDRSGTDYFEITRDEDQINLGSTISGSGSRSTSKIIVSVFIRDSSGLISFETKPDTDNTAIFYETSETFEIINGYHQGNASSQSSSNGTSVSVLNWFNCYAMGEGVESIYYLDSFNKKYLNIDLRPNSTSVTGFSKVRRFADLTYSAVYNENTNVNGLNEFNLYKANYKDDIDKKYGPIQKIHSRDTNLLVFQEDKIHRVLFGKDALYNADGDTNITAIENVLGTHIALTGEYGISKNPESFAFDSNRIYFTDAKRGSVLRYSNDGLTEISSYGMRRYFKDQLKNGLTNKKVGGFDPYNDFYVLSLSSETISTPIIIECGQTFKQSDFIGKLTHTLSLGTQLGETGVQFVTNGVPTTVSVIWNGNTYSSGEINDTETHTITFDKNRITPSTATLVIEALSCGADISLSNICIDSPEITVVSIVLNDASDDGLERVNRFSWSNGDYTSNYNTINSKFEGTTDVFIDGREAAIDIFTSQTGEQGVDVFPIGGSTVLMQSIASVNNTMSFNEGDRFGYLVSNTAYTISDIQTIISGANFIGSYDGFEINNEPVKFDDFIVPETNNKYVYLIWDYINKNEAPIGVSDFISVEKGDTVTTNLVENDTDADGDALSIGIITQPSYGTVTFSGGFATYTHDNTENFNDSFTYQPFDGLEYGNPVTVLVSIGVSCSNGINASGSDGIYETTVNLGTDLGSAGISYNAFSVRDRFQLYFDDVLVADSLYVGSSGNQIGTFTLPVLEYNNGSFTATGEERTIVNTQSDISGTPGSGTLTFEKTSALPTTMKVVVTGTTSGTAWSFNGICPVPI